MHMIQVSRRFLFSSIDEFPVSTAYAYSLIFAAEDAAVYRLILFFSVFLGNQ